MNETCQRLRLTQPFKWIGSKVRMRSKLLEIFQEIPRKLYVEPFGGSGAMFFGKAPENSVYNDKNGLLVNFFRKLRSRRDRETIQEIATYTPQNSEYWHEFKIVCKAWNNGDDDKLNAALERANLAEYDVETAVAFAFFYCQRLAFGGTFLHAYGEYLKPDCVCSYNRCVGDLSEYAKHLTQTSITRRDFAECIEKHDHPQTLFYCDPPYECASSVDYQSSWGGEDSKRLVEILCNVKGNVVLSCYDCEIYYPLLDCGYIRRSFDVRSSLRAKDKFENSARVETVYIKNNAAKLARLF